MYTTHTLDDPTNHDTFNDMLKWLEHQQDDGETIKVTLEGKDITSEVAEQLLVFWHDNFEPTNHEYCFHPMLDNHFDVGAEIQGLNAVIAENDNHIRQESMMSGGGL